MRSRPFTRRSASLPPKSKCHSARRSARSAPRAACRAPARPSRPAAVGLVRVAGRIGVGHHGADVVADDVGSVDAQLVQHGADVGGLGLLVVAAFRAWRTGPCRAGRARRPRWSWPVPPPAVPTCRRYRRSHAAAPRPVRCRRRARAAGALDLDLLGLEAGGKGLGWRLPAGKTAARVPADRTGRVMMLGGA